LTKEALQVSADPEKPIPPPDGGIEGACGLAIGQSGALYVSDYYHRLIYTYKLAGQLPEERYEYASSTSLGISPEGPCQLAADSKGALYANLWHQSAIRVSPTLQTFDIASSTGVALDAEGRVYVNDRTHVNVYGSAGALLQEVGLGNLKDAYGLAVFGSKLYVPDAGTNTIKVFEPQSDPQNPKQTITGAKTPQKHFVSLVDASVAIDPTNGHILVLDDLQPGFEHPEGAIDEFDSNGVFLAQLKDRVIDGGPSGLVVDPETGVLLASSGNSEGANVFAFGPYAEGVSEAVGGVGDGPPRGAEGGLAEGGEAEPAAALGEAVAASVAAERASVIARAHRQRHHRRAHRHQRRHKSAALRG
jgi:DNA-binding beta-propeller fold protein YncE